MLLPCSHTKDNNTVTPPPTLNARARQTFDGALTALATPFVRANIDPNWLTWGGLGVVLLAAVLIGMGQVVVGGLVLIVGLPLDALDGQVARLSQRVTKFGGLLDSTLDRYADSMIFGALCYHFARQSQLDWLLVTMTAWGGAFAVSYIRARAGEAGLSVKVGWFDRMVRLVLLLVGLCLPPLLQPMLAVLAVGSNATALQRLWYVYQQIDRQ
jgi:CDP-diacylglycerol---glycerol-3-phosphate 3-phosphatidyltransferase